MNSTAVPTQRPSVPGPDEPAPAQMMQGLARHSIIYAIGIIVGRSVSFLMLPLYTRHLTPADYGVMALVEMTLDFIAIVAGAKLALGVFRFYHKAETAQEREDVVSTSYLLVAALYAVVGLCAFLAARPLSLLLFGSPENTLLFQLGASNVALGALLIVPLSLARVRDRSWLFVGMNMIKLVLQVVLVLVFLVWLQMGVTAVFLASLIANAVVGIGASAWLIRTVQLRWSPATALHLVRYGAPLVATQFATFVATFSDRFFLQAAADEAVVGLYSVAYQFGFILVVMGFSPLEHMWGPKRFQIARRPDRDALLARGFILINTVVVSVAVGISLFVYDLLRVMATPQFHGAAAVVPIILAAYVLQCWGSTLDLGIHVAEKTKYVALANYVASAVAVIGYAIFIPLFLAWGAAAVTLLTFVIQFSLLYTFSQRLWPVRYQWRPVVVLLAWAAVIGGTALLLPTVGVGPSIATRCVLGVVYLVGVWRLPVLDDSERAEAHRLALQALTLARRAFRRTQPRGAALSE